MYKKSIEKRPIPFPKESSIVTPTKKPKKCSKLLGVEKTPEKNEQEPMKDSEGSDSEQKDKIKFTVKRDWEGVLNYFPSNVGNFEMYYPENLKMKK